VSTKSGNTNKIETNEKNAKTGELAFSNSFLLMVGICLLFVMTLKEVFFKWQRRIFTTVFNRSCNCLLDGQKIFNLPKKFPEKT
jgi:hypothetical protein